MRGPFAQYGSRDDDFDALGLRADEIIDEPEPIGRFSVAPGTKVLLLNERGDGLHFDPVYRGYGPACWGRICPSSAQPPADQALPGQ